MEMTLHQDQDQDLLDFIHEQVQIVSEKILAHFSEKGNYKDPFLTKEVTDLAKLGIKFDSQAYQKKGSLWSQIKTYLHCTRDTMPVSYAYTGKALYCLKLLYEHQSIFPHTNSNHRRTLFHIFTDDFRYWDEYFNSRKYVRLTKDDKGIIKFNKVPTHIFNRFIEDYMNDRFHQNIIKRLSHNLTPVSPSKIADMDGIQNKVFDEDSLAILRNKDTDFEEFMRTVESLGQKAQDIAEKELQDYGNNVYPRLEYLEFEMLPAIRRELSMIFFAPVDYLSTEDFDNSFLELLKINDELETPLFENENGLTLFKSPKQCREELKNLLPSNNELRQFVFDELYYYNHIEDFDTLATKLGWDFNSLIAAKRYNTLDTTMDSYISQYLSRDIDDNLKNFYFHTYSDHLSSLKQGGEYVISHLRKENVMEEIKAPEVQDKINQRLQELELEEKQKQAKMDAEFERSLKARNKAREDFQAGLDKHGIQYFVDKIFYNKDFDYIKANLSYRKDIAVPYSEELCKRFYPHLYDDFVKFNKEVVYPDINGAKRSCFNPAFFLHLDSYLYYHPLHTPRFVFESLFKWQSSISTNFCQYQSNLFSCDLSSEDTFKRDFDKFMSMDDHHTTLCAYYMLASDRYIDSLSKIYGRFAKAKYVEFSQNPPMELITKIRETMPYFSNRDPHKVPENAAIQASSKFITVNNISLTVDTLFERQKVFGTENPEFKKFDWYKRARTFLKSGNRPEKPAPEKIDVSNLKFNFLPNTEEAEKAKIEKPQLKNTSPSTPEISEPIKDSSPLIPVQEPEDLSDQEIYEKFLSKPVRDAIADFEKKLGVPFFDLIEKQPNGRLFTPKGKMKFRSTSLTRKLRIMCAMQYNMKCVVESNIRSWLAYVDPESDYYKFNDVDTKQLHKT